MKTKKQQAVRPESDPIERFLAERSESFRIAAGIALEEGQSLPVEMEAPAKPSQAVQTQETYSVAEAAKILKVSLVTVYRLIERGKLRCLKSLRHKRIPKTELDRFIKEDLG